jgi:hypothetical protein
MDDDDDTQVYQTYQTFGLVDQSYVIGWNDALDEAASRIGEIKGFGQATQDSFAVFIKGLKK